ncbi:MAG: DUF3810 family protein [Planctomycetota bacterium]
MSGSAESGARVESPLRRHGRTVAWVAAALVVVAGLVLPADVMERGYSRTLFPILQKNLVPVTGAVDWPLMGSLLLAVPALLALVGVRRWRRGRRCGEARWALLVAGAVRLMRGALVVAAAFLLIWGLGYRRVPIEERWHLGETELLREHVADVQMRLLRVLHEDGDRAHGDAERAWRAVASAERELVEELEGWLPAVPRYIKEPPDGWLMALGIYGIVSPFTLEAHVDGALPLPMLLGIRAHELAHLFGYCGEADANLVGFVAGLRAADPLARYGTALSMVRYAMSREDEGSAARFYKLLPERAKADLRELSERRKRHSVPTLARVSRAVNDTYLKTQGVALGTDDYARGFTLFVRAYRCGLVPLPPPYVPPRVAPRGR